MATKTKLVGQKTERRIRDAIRVHTAKRGFATQASIVHRTSIATLTVRQVLRRLRRRGVVTTTLVPVQGAREVRAYTPKAS